MAFKTSGTLRSRINSARSSTARTYRDNSSDAFVVYGPGAPSDVTIKRAGVIPGSADSLTSLSGAGGGTTISSVVITDSSYTTIDDTAINTAGGYAKILGTGFVSGCTVYLNGSAVTTTFISSTEVRVVIPATTNGTYSLMLFNPDTTGAIYLNLLFSDSPAWITGAGSIGSYYETQNVSNTVVANTVGNTSITYSLYSGNLPSGTTLAANGLLSGTAPAETSQTTYSFVVNATDAQNQNTTRSFNLTINTDVVTWSAPSEGTSYSVGANTAISNVSLSATNMVGGNISYSANALPSNVFLSGNVIYGTPNVVGNVSTLLTATSATTSRSNTRTISWVVSIATDEYFKYVTTLLSASTPTTLPFNDDASTNNFAVTINGDTKPFNFNPYTDGYYSNYFDGTGDNLLTSSSAVQTIGTGQFTVELWVYHTASSSPQQYLDSATNGFSLSLVSSAVQLSQASVAVLLNSTTTLSINTWNHIAVTRNASNLVTIWINGVSSGTATLTTNFTNTSFYIGSRTGNTINLNGYMSNLRIVKGQALYTSAFTPSTSPLTTTSQGATASNVSLLTCQSNRFIDNSTNNFTITKNGDTKVSSFIPFTPNSSYSTYGSTYFDGTGDYLTFPQNAAFNLSSNSFTIECWVYFNNTTGTQPIFALDTTSYPAVLIQSESGVIKAYATSASTSWDMLNGTTFGSVSAGQWYNVALTRSGTTFRTFLNGSLVTTVASTSVPIENQGSSGRIATSDAANYLNGYISDFRIVNGTAVYTSAFTPPTTPLTAISGTSLLTCQSNQPVANNTFLDNSTNNFAITRNGNTTQGTFSPYGSNWSNYFDGSGDYLSASTNTAFNISGGDFTVEAWVYLTALPSTNIDNGRIGCVLNYGSTTTNQGYEFNLDLTANKITFQSVGTANQMAASYTFSIGTWYHVAATRSGATDRLFVNGQSLTLTSNTFPNNSSTTGTLKIGAGRLFTNYNHDFPGYITNVRIVKGTAVYTGAFTPSTTPLQSIAKTSLLTCQSPNLVDKSPNNFTLTKNGDVSVQKFGPFSATTLPTPYYSSYFDGSSYVTVANNGGTITTGVFTLEFWVYPTSISNGPIPVENYTWSTGNNAGWHTTINSNGTVALNASTGVFNASTTIITSTGTVSINTWSHIAYVRDSNNVITIYINGVNSGTTTYSASLNQSYGGASPVTRFGSHLADGAVSNGLSGFISNLRLVIGTAVYTSGFTPPTSPLTAISGTTMLVCQSNTQIDNSSNANTLTPGSTVKPLTISPFTLTYSTSQSYTPSVYGGSAYFDGTGDSLALTTTTPLVMNTYPFTMEAWVYPTSYAHGFNIIQSRVNNSTGAGTYSFYISTAGAVAFDQVQTPTTIITTASSAVPLNVWTHVAVVRNSSNVWYLYVNGVSSGTTAPTNAYDFSSTNTTYIGYNSDTNNYSSYGYISDVRVIKGQALYTSNFVPLNAPLQAVKNTTLLVNSTNSGIYDSSEMNNFESVGDAKLSTTTVKFSGTTSMYFDGTGDYLTTTTAQTLKLAGDFTIETWFYLASTGNYYPNIITSGNTALRFGNNGFNNLLQFGIDTSSVSTTYSCNQTQSALANQWVHVAWTRSSGTNRLFVNGILQNIGTGAPATSFGSTSFSNSSTIGSTGWQIGNGWNGYLSDFRITNGIARYTSNFSVPTSPFQQK